MNIFVTSKCPFESAEYLDWKRAIKMILESAQMMSTAIHIHGGKAPYKPTHQKHPCTLWVAKTRENYSWLFLHFMALCERYTKKYGKVHKCATLTGEFFAGGDYIPDGDLTPFQNSARNKSLGLDFTHIEDVPTAYRLYLEARNKL